MVQFLEQIKFEPEHVQCNIFKGKYCGYSFYELIELFEIAIILLFFFNNNYKLYVSLIGIY